jgi:hypothetical protein
MAKDSLFVSGGQIGRGAKLKTHALYPQQRGGFVQNSQVELGDIPTDMMRRSSKVLDGKPRGERIGVKVRAPGPPPESMPVRLTPTQVPDFNSYGFDEQGLAVNVPAGTTVDVASYTLQRGTRGVVSAYGWFPQAAGQLFLTFALYIGDQIMLPGGHLGGATPRLITVFTPSGGAIADAQLAKTYLPVLPDRVISVKCTNADPVNDYTASARIKGWEWQLQTQEDIAGK